MGMGAACEAATCEVATGEAATRELATCGGATCELATCEDANGAGADCTEGAVCTDWAAACDGKGASTPTAQSARFKAATHAHVAPDVSIVKFNGTPPRRLQSSRAYPIKG